MSVANPMQMGDASQHGVRAGLSIISRPLVSVVIPTHNRAVLLAQAIESVRQQTYEHLEIVVVDDASTDATAEVVARISDPRIRYMRHVSNKGGSATRNTGIKAATGMYIAFLDDDDIWHLQKTEKQMEAIRGYDAVLCSSHHAMSTRHRIKKKEICLNDLRQGPFAVGGTGVLMARAEVLKTTLFDESLPMGQDWDVFIRIAEKHRVAYLDIPLLTYNEGTHQRITNAAVGMSVADLERRSAILRKHRNFFGNRWYKRHLSALFLYGIKYRPNKIRHLWYTIRRCGVYATMMALVRRGYQKTSEWFRALVSRRAEDGKIGVL